MKSKVKFRKHDLSDPRLRDLVYDKFNGKCAYCGCDINRNKFTIDHIIPIRRGDKFDKTGLSELSNYNPSCISCNSSKSTFSIEGWRLQINEKKKRLERDSSQFRLLKRFGLIEVNEELPIFYFEKNI